MGQKGSCASYTRKPKKEKGIEKRKKTTLRRIEKKKKKKGPWRKPP